MIINDNDNEGSNGWYQSSKWLIMVSMVNNGEWWFDTGSWYLVGKKQYIYIYTHHIAS